MIVRRFLLWARHAAPRDRAEAVGALAKAYLDGDLSPADRAEAGTALTAMLDDPSPLVRVAMAEVLAPSEYAPRHVILALAGDQSEAAAIVLARSPVIADCDLVDCAAVGEARIQAAIASRPYVSTGVSAALAEIGAAEALAVLAGNPGAEIMPATFTRMIQRHGDDGALREALLARPDLPLEIIQAVAAAVSDTLNGFVTGCGWLSLERSNRVTREARERATVALTGGADGDDLQRLVSHLRRSGQLTPVLILRALLSCRTGFAEAALADLSGYPVNRVSAILHERRGAGFRALYARTGLPASLRIAFEAALSGLREVNPEGGDEDPRLSRRMVERALGACAALSPDESGRITALLRRFEVEAAVEEARSAADAMADDAALVLILEHAPETLILDPTRDRLIAA
jgi:uncharacterized protein (DUF2336 family)